MQGTEPTQLDNLYQPVLINRETGNLATLYTPAELVEERIYLIPPPGTEAWAESAGIDQPPQEYDVLLADSEGSPDVSVFSPEPFSIIRGTVSVRGRVRPEDLDYFRLQVGAGLNPTRWILFSDQDSPVYSGNLGELDTAGLDGLYTIQLIAVLSDGALLSDAVTVTIDNQPPEVSILAPAPNSLWEVKAGEELRIQVAISDEVGVDRVVLYVDNRLVAEVGDAPFSFIWATHDIGDHVLTARGYDLAGNFNHSDSLLVEVVR